MEKLLTDAELATALANRMAPTVTKDSIEAQIASEHFIRPDTFETTLTICILVLVNGFHVTGESACADPANFDEEIGRKIARDNAFAKIWALEGYLLRERIHQQARMAEEAARCAEASGQGPFNGTVVDAIAEACHEANRLYCVSIGDESQPTWADAPEWQKQSAIKGVQFVLDNPEAPLSAQHESWLAEKEAQGWKYGPVKDEELKEHPCFLPYDELPEEQKLKDQLFRDTVNSFFQNKQ